ncbi:MAG: hypothetical protein AB1465_01535 [Patescibacteria group bacterium]
MYQRLDSQKSYRGIFIFFVLITLALIIFVLYTSFSQAIITLTPKKDKVSVDFGIKIEKNEKLDQEPKILAGRVLQTQETAEEKITDIPKIKTGDRAHGKVTIYNQNEEAMGIVAKTQLRHETTGQIFRTDQAINIPPRGKVEVEVTADQPGTNGEVEPDNFRLIKLSPEWQKIIYGESKEKFKIIQKEVKIATAEFMEKEKQKIVENLEDTARTKLEDKLSGSEKIPKKAIKYEILESKASVEPETETEEFTIFIRVKITALVFNEDILFNIAQEKIKEKTTSEQEFLKSDKESIKYEILNYDLNSQKTTVKVHLEGEVQSKLNAEEIDREKLLGRKDEEVKMYFNSDPKVENVEVLFSPFWVNRVPTLKDHIEIVVKK